MTATIPSAEKLSRPKPGCGSWWSAMKKTGLAIPQPIVSSSSKWRRQPSGREQRVVERRAALEVGDLQEDVVQHRGREAIRATRRKVGRWQPQPRRGVQRKKRIASSRPATPQIATTARSPQASAGAAAGHVGVEEGLEEVADREEVGEVEDPAGELVVGDEDAGEEVERQQQRVDDRRGGVLGGDQPRSARCRGSRRRRRRRRA